MVYVYRWVWVYNLGVKELFGMCEVFFNFFVLYFWGIMGVFVYG